MNHRTPSLPPKTALTRFSVAPLSTMTRRLADVASGRAPADLVVTGARVLSTYSERIAPEREVWIAGGRIAAVKPAGAYRQVKGQPGRIYDARGGIVAPGLVDPHIHIESSMVTACAYAEAALLNGTTTIFCDSHEIGNVMDSAGIEMMLEDARHAPLSIFLTVPSTVPATTPDLETAGGDLTPAVSRSGVVAGTVLGTVRKMESGAWRASSSIISMPAASITLPISWLSQKIVVVPLSKAASA